METKKYKLKELKVADYNPRKMDQSVYDKLKRSIKEFGYLEPIIFNKKTGNIVGGNHRYEVLKEEYGLNHCVDVIVVDMDLKKEKALNLALNKISGEWNQDKLREVFKDIDNISDLTGFDNFEKETILFEMPELGNIDIIGKQIGLRYPLTFTFSSEKEFKEITDFFNKTDHGWKYRTEPNSMLLKQLIEEEKERVKEN